ncbi:uncharacterized protein LOC125442475 [Sphaerodactylus townsendi]|uniref:uncharacterized protein LOC125442475 n=1 Tax=Sphaerodactylus townsendi TaxID=933632 RepID=UPI0020260E23|nr:uncharacterized protein LOC125442475 [Sphaerodactylus townsendi]
MERERPLSRLVRQHWGEQWGEGAGREEKLHPSHRKNPNDPPLSLLAEPPVPEVLSHPNIQRKKSDCYSHASPHLEIEDNSSTHPSHLNPPPPFSKDQEARRRRRRGLFRGPERRSRWLRRQREAACLSPCVSHKAGARSARGGGGSHERRSVDGIYYTKKSPLKNLLPELFQKHRRFPARPPFLSRGPGAGGTFTGSCPGTKRAPPQGDSLPLNTFALPVARKAVSRRPHGAGTHKEHGVGGDFMAQTSPLLDSKVGDANAGEGGFLRVGRRRRTEKNTAEGPGACLETEKRRFFPAAADCPFTPCRAFLKHNETEKRSSRLLCVVPFQTALLENSPESNPMNPTLCQTNRESQRHLLSRQFRQL